MAVARSDEPALAGGRLPAVAASELLKVLLRPETYPSRPARIELLQTHISYVLLAGADVYKIKKPVRFSFLDFSTLERRRRFCDEEVRLNRRLAPDVYLGVVSICPSGDGFRFGEAEDPAAVEYAVHMRRLDDVARLDCMLRTGTASTELMDAIASRLAEFHAAARTGPEITANGSPAAVWAILEDNFANARRFRGSTVAAQDDDAIQAFARSFLDRHRELFGARQAAGRVRECHGDLHADHVYATQPLTIVDCIEFNTQFRYCDVASDLAFLAMDIDFHGRPDLSTRLVDRYVEVAGDPGVRTLLPFYKCYRAYVRGKVDSLKSIEPEVDAAEQLVAAAGARAHFGLSYRYTWSGLPGLVVLSGLSGSGKSVVAAALAERTGFTHINSDVVRKRLAGLGLTERPAASDDLYSQAHTQRTYAAMFEAAAAELRAERGAILDATFQRRSDRVAARELASAAGRPCLFVECRCPEVVVRQRLAERTARDDSPSDADWEIYLKQRADFEAFGEGEVDLAVDTTAPLEDVVCGLERELRQRLAAALV